MLSNFNTDARDPNFSFNRNPERDVDPGGYA
jgi:hypothetical protein